MSELRIKVKYQHFEIEIEGDKDTVHNEFNDIKEKGLGNLFGKIELYPDTAIIEENPKFIEESKPEINKHNIPSLKDIVMKQLPASEAEWVLVYAFYVLDSGSETFSHSDIVSMYEATKRTTPNRKANLSNSIKQLFKAGNFSALNDNDYILTEEGKQMAYEIITRAKGNIVKPSGKTSKKEEVKEIDKNKTKTSSLSSSSQNFKVLSDLNLRPKNGKALIDFSNQYKLNAYPEKILVIVYYLEQELKINPITIDHIFTGLKELKEKIPPSLKTIISNIKTRNTWLKFDKLADIKCSIQGCNHVEHDLLKR